MTERETRAGGATRMQVWLLLALCLSWVGCGSEKSSAETATGDLRVVVRGVGKLDWVERVEFELDPQGKGTSAERTLSREKEGEDWEAHFPGLVAGPYFARATAYGAEGTRGAASHPVQVVVPEGKEALLFLILEGALRPDPPVDFPFFASVFLDRQKVEQWEELRIQVQGGGGREPLVLSGREPAEEGPRGTFSDPQELRFAGEAIGEAELTWTPPAVEGERPLILRLTEARGNTTELSVPVLVGEAYGSVEIDGTLHLAPTIRLQSRITNDTAGTLLLAWAEVEADPGRARPAEWRYRWESADCQGSFLSEGGAAEGVFEENDPERPGAMHFRYFIEDEERPEAGNCVLRFTLTEWSEGAGGALEEGISRALHVDLDASLTQPTAP